jgi:hypothetical protein
MNFLLPILILVAAGAGGVYLVGRYTQGQKQRKLILDRDPLVIATIYREVFPQADVPLENFKTVWLKIAALLETPAEKLRPADRFDREFLPTPNDGRDDRLLLLDHYIRSIVPDGKEQTLSDVGSLVRYLLARQSVIK